MTDAPRRVRITTEQHLPAFRPVWGKVVGRSVDETLHVHWLSGPDGRRDVESIVGVSGVLHFAAVPSGAWFYGIARDDGDAVTWDELPEPLAVGTF